MGSGKDEKENSNISDLLKKVVNTGLSAAFMTEDAVKNIMQDLPVPKEIVNGLVQNAKNSKDEFISSVKTELKSYLERIDLQKEIDRIIEGYDIEINAKIKFKKKTEIKSKVKSTKSKKDE